MDHRIVSVLLFSASLSISAAEWHHPLYLGNDGHWRQRICVEIHNGMEREAAGVPLFVRIGKEPGQADMSGTPAEAVRVCSAEGTELLYSIVGSAGDLITRGPIPDGSTLAIPAECPSKGTAHCYVYFDNPAAWPVPDFLKATMGVLNGGLEEGAGDGPSAWRHDANDEQHRTFWVTEGPRAGKRCLKTVVADGAEHTWIATRQGNIHIIGGARYVMRAWVKAENVKGFAGWYIHVGNRDNYMLTSPMLNGGDGTYGWKELKAEFVAPQEADVADLGTVLRGTGTAWFDDVTLECLTPAKLTATAQKLERFRLREVGATAAWYDSDPNDDVHWDYRVPVKIANFSRQPLDEQLTYVDLSTVTARLTGKINEDSIRVTDGTKEVAHYCLKAGLLLGTTAPAETIRTYYVYLSADGRVKAPATADYSALLTSGRNLAKNASFELGEDLPEAWPGGAEGQRPAGAVMGFDEPGLFGERCVKMHIPHDAEKAWTGWRQDVPVQPGKKYLLSAWLKCEDIQEGSVQLHAHYRNATGDLCGKKFTGTGPAITGTHDWTVMSGMFTMPDDIATFQLHLTMLATGTAWHDGVVLAEVAGGTTGKLETRTREGLGELTVWPVNAIVKVFQDDVPPREIPPARVTAARNEKEPLQLAVRSPKALSQVRVEVEPPLSREGSRLSDVEVTVVGYVPMDHKTSYYSTDSPGWHRKYPTSPGACDGWAGMWPDPLLLRNTFDLTPDVTQPVWVTVDVPKGAKAGDYAGKVRLVSDGKALRTIPFTVHVWDFTLPEENHLKAIYDLRLSMRLWHQPGKSKEELHRQFWRFMADRRVCPHRVYPWPKITYEKGKVVADFTEFDRAASYYLDVLKLSHTYTPWYFYCFGWGHPPGKKFGEQPYEGKYPYEDLDRTKLRPEFKKAYQACLKVYWDHLKAKGWDKKCVLYISDEPYYRHEHIRAQMKALCDMIHEADPDIPIYCSTWHHRPEWDGYLDVWGIGHYGLVSPEKMNELRAAGDRLWFTTDGQMCTDTPYCGVERLLPHYCFKYGVEAYEFWGVDWLTYDPYEFGWHRYIHQSGEPGQSTWVRYPNGDGFLAYPGAAIGHDGPVSSVRLDQAREGVEDYEYLYLLRSLVARAKAAGRGLGTGEDALALAAKLVDIPNAGGRYSTKILPDPDAVLRVKEAVAKAIESLSAF